MKKINVVLEMQHDRKKESILDDIWHRIGRIVRISKLGAFIFFVLNIRLLLCFLCPNELLTESVLSIVAGHLTTV